MIKKILTIIIILIVIILAGFGFWYFTQNGGAVSTGEEDGFSIRDLFPFGQGDVSVPAAPTDQTAQENGTGAPTTPTKLRQIYAYPVSGAAMFTTGSTTVTRFLEKATGNIHEAETDTTLVRRISNTTVPKVSEAVFVSKDSVLLRYLRDDGDLIETIFGKLGTSTTVASALPTEEKGLLELKSTFLFPNIKEVTLSPKKDKIFYTTEFSTGVVGTLSDPDGSKKSQLWSHPLREWVTQWPKADTVALTTRASAGIGGYLYFANTTTGKNQTVLSGVPGLTTLTSPTAETVLYTESNTDGRFSLKTYKPAAGTTEPVALSPTLPEKCVWSKKNTDVVFCAVPHFIPTEDYPDTWYKGLVSFSDSLWKLDTATSEATFLVNIKGVSGRDIDVINPSLDESEHFLLFMNKKDLTLWSYDLSAL